MFPARNELVTRVHNLPVFFALSFQVDDEAIRCLGRQRVWDAKTVRLTHWLIWSAPPPPVPCHMTSRHAPGLLLQQCAFLIRILHIRSDRFARQEYAFLGEPSFWSRRVQISSDCPNTASIVLSFCCMITPTWAMSCTRMRDSPLNIALLWSRVSGVNTPEVSRPEAKAESSILCPGRPTGEPARRGSSHHEITLRDADYHAGQQHFATAHATNESDPDRPSRPRSSGEREPAGRARHQPALLVPKPTGAIAAAVAAPPAACRCRAPSSSPPARAELVTPVRFELHGRDRHRRGAAGRVEPVAQTREPG